MFVQTFGINHCNNNELLQNTTMDIDRNYAELCNDLDLVSRFCLPICCRDNEIREVALDVISKTVEGWLDGVGSPKHSNIEDSQDNLPSINNINTFCEKENGESKLRNGQSIIVNISKEYMDLVALHLPIILRLSINCPFTNVREKCKHILQIVRDRGLPVPFPVKNGPSEYINPSEFLSWDTQCDKEFYLAANIPVAHSSDEPTEARPPIFFDTTPTNDMGQIGHGTHTLFIDAFLQNNRLDHVSQVMGLHPAYLNHFLKTQYFILRGDGPLPYDFRHYIAIMAAGRHQCSYLISLQKQEFLLQGGNPQWLKGLSYIPRKLRNLYEINKILGHRPWLLNKSHIEKLTKGGPDSWSLAEVVHAIVILGHFHSLCSFVFSCGVNEEVDQAGGHAYQASNPSPDDDSSAIAECTTSNNISRSQSQKIVNDTRQNHEGATSFTGRSPPPEPEVGIVTLMARMKTLSERTEECTQTELTKRFENVESQSAELGAVPEPITEVAADISQFIDDPNFLYQDFAKRGETSDIPTFRVQDYSWDDHGYSLVNRLYNDVGYLLDDKFKTAYNLTYYTMGGRRDVDTSRFRRAIWNYIQCMFGIRHDDYDYGEINHLLERSLKTFIKSACCYPERVTKKDYDRVLREFEHSEKVHVNLMVLESRMQAELLYALKAVMRYMT